MVYSYREATYVQFPYQSDHCPLVCSAGQNSLNQIPDLLGQEMPHPESHEQKDPFG
jgi:hypothetical protein